MKNNIHSKTKSTSKDIETLIGMCTHYRFPGFRLRSLGQSVDNDENKPETVAWLLKKTPQEVHGRRIESSLMWMRFFVDMAINIKLTGHKNLSRQDNLSTMFCTLILAFLFGTLLEAEGIHIWAQRLKIGPWRDIAIQTSDAWLGVSRYLQLHKPRGVVLQIKETLSTKEMAGSLIHSPSLIALNKGGEEMLNSNLPTLPVRATDYAFTKMEFETEVQVKPAASFMAMSDGGVLVNASSSLDAGLPTIHTFRQAYLNGAVNCAMVNEGVSLADRSSSSLSMPTRIKLEQGLTPSFRLFDNIISYEAIMSFHNKTYSPSYFNSVKVKSIMFPTESNFVAENSTFPVGALLKLSPDPLFCVSPSSRLRPQQISMLLIENSQTPPLQRSAIIPLPAHASSALRTLVQPSARDGGVAAFPRVLSPTDSTSVLNTASNSSQTGTKASLSESTMGFSWEWMPDPPKLLSREPVRSFQKMQPYAVRLSNELFFGEQFGWRSATQVRQSFSPLPSPLLIMPQLLSNKKELDLLARPPFKVALAGDSMMAVGLAPTLKRWLSQQKDIHVIQAYRSGTGLLRPEVFDWNVEYPRILGNVRPSIVICSMGANDAQSVQIGKRVLQFDTPEWDDYFRSRITSYLNLVAREGTHVLWVGLPEMRSPEFDKKIAHVNMLIKAMLQRYPNTTWLDSNSKLIEPTLGQGFKQYRADSQGKMVKIRANDGIHLTDDGAMYLLDPIRSWITVAMGQKATSN